MLHDHLVDAYGTSSPSRWLGDHTGVYELSAASKYVRHRAGGDQDVGFVWAGGLGGLGGLSRYSAGLRLREISGRDSGILRVREVSVKGS